MPNKFTCLDCEYCEVDCYYDNEGCEEYEVLSCEKGHWEHVNWDAEPCKDFKED